MSTRAVEPTWTVKGWHVLAAMLLFFGTVIAVNIAFAVMAVRTFPGEDEKNSYRQGLHFNQTLAQRAAQAELGWKAEIGLEALGRGARLRVVMVDASGRPVDGLAISGKVRRPATTREDRAVTFTPSGHGLYVADVGALESGSWTFEGAAVRDGQTFAFERRMAWQAPPKS